MALGLLHALDSHGIAVPSAMSTVGFDDIPEAAFLSPALTTVRQDFNEMGRLGMSLLLDILTADRHPTEPIALIEPDLVVRASTGPPPAHT